MENVSPSELKTMPYVLERVEKVRAFRLDSGRKRTLELAEYPTLFGEIRQSTSDYLAIPIVSSERRKYIPMRFFSKNTIANNKCQTIPNATIYTFGILTSLMHNVWTKKVCGRMKSDISYSNRIVYRAC